MATKPTADCSPTWPRALGPDGEPAGGQPQPPSVEDTDWEYSEFALYDLGQAVAHMTVQAHALDLHVRQFRAFDRDGIAAAFAVPAHWEVTTLSAVGRVARADRLEGPPPPPVTERQRRPLDNLRWVSG